MKNPVIKLERYVYLLHSLGVLSDQEKYEALEKISKDKMSRGGH